MSTIETLTIKLYEQINGEYPDDKTSHLFREIIVDNGLDNDEAAPEWFLSLWRALVNGTKVERTYFNIDEILAHNGVDIVNFLAELSEMIDIGYENYGEGIVMNLKPSEVKVFISFEGPCGKCFYEIDILPDVEDIDF